MKTEMVSLSELRLHPEYIRHRKMPEYIDELATVLSESGWVFPPIELQPIASTEEIYKEGKRYYILDGTNRVEAAIKTEYAKKIPANIHLPMTMIDAIAVQVKFNLSHGMRLSVADQTAAVKRMAELGMEGKKIAKETGLSAPSVSRIVQGKQRSTPDGSPGNVNKASAKPFKVVDWMKRLSSVIKAYQKHGSKIRKAGFPVECQKAIDTMIDNLLDKKED